MLFNQRRVIVFLFNDTADHVLQIENIYTKSFSFNNGETWPMIFRDLY
jgi:hypothetical protein